MRIQKIAAQFRSALDLYLAKVTDSKPFQLFLEHKRHVTIFLYTAWLSGCGYWLYHLMVIDVKPNADFGLVLTDSRDALVILFFGALGSGFVLFFAWFMIKFIWNLFHHGIDSFFSVRWHSLVKPASYLVILCFAFPFTGTIKTAGLTAYNQIAELVHTSAQQHVVIQQEIPGDLERKLSGLMKLIEKDEQE